MGGGREGTGEETQQTPLQATERRQPPQQDRELAVLRTLLAVPELMEQLLLAFERGLVEVRARGLEQVKGREGRWLIMRWRGGIKITLECLSREVMGFSLNHKPLP